MKFTKFRIIAGGVLAIALIAGIVVGSFALSQAVRRTAAPITGETGRIETVNRPGFRIAAYNRFYELEEQAGRLEVLLDAWTLPVTDRRERTECRGQLATHAQRVAEYNRRARSIDTTGQWRDAGLPDELKNYDRHNCQEETQ